MIIAYNHILQSYGHDIESRGVNLQSHDNAIQSYGLNIQSYDNIHSVIRPRHTECGHYGQRNIII